MGVKTKEGMDERLELSAEQWLAFKALMEGHGEQDENGVDLSVRCLV